VCPVTVRPTGRCSLISDILGSRIERDIAWLSLHLHVEVSFNYPRYLREVHCLNCHLFLFCDFFALCFCFVIWFLSSDFNSLSLINVLNGIIELKNALSCYLCIVCVCVCMCVRERERERERQERKSVVVVDLSKQRGGIAEQDTRDQGLIPERGTGICSCISRFLLPHLFLPHTLFI